MEFLHQAIDALIKLPQLILTGSFRKIFGKIPLFDTVVAAQQFVDRLCKLFEKF